MASRGALEWIGMFEGPADIYYYSYAFETRLHTGLSTRLPNPKGHRLSEA